jgi:hypothetical protein
MVLWNVCYTTHLPDRYIQSFSLPAITNATLLLLVFNPTLQSLHPFAPLLRTLHHCLNFSAAATATAASTVLYTAHSHLCAVFPSTSAQC